MDFLLNMLIPAAQAAEGAAPAQQPSMLPTIAMLAVFGFIFYFMLYRPQAKRAKDHKNMLDALQKGDEVVTSGGILGKVVKLTDDYIEISLTESVDIKVQKQSIVAVLPKGTLKSI
ncbi:MAG: preprotein translocase subunit YajC [Gammaproteobacteria bacterium]|nr:preprotein translocase subunit YajC [Gammaproteobacteria bacterium]